MTIINCGVISDTHVPRRAHGIPEKVFEIFQDYKVQFIFHAGDLVDMLVVDSLGQFGARVFACHGNMDPYIVRSQLPSVAECLVLNYQIAIIHDLHQFPVAHSKHDVIISGHTHKARISKECNRLFINPGSPTDTWRDKRTVGILKISKDSIEGTIVRL